MTFISPKTPSIRGLKRHLFPHSTGEGYIFPKGSDGRYAFKDISGDDRQIFTASSLSCDSFIGPRLIFDNNTGLTPISSTQSITISMWLKFNGNESEDTERIVLSLQAGITDALGLQDLTIGFMSRDIVLLFGDRIPFFTDNEWTHLLLERLDNGSFKIFRNNELIGVTAPKAVTILPNIVSFGRAVLTNESPDIFFENNTAWKGSIFDARIWYKRLSTQEQRFVYLGEILGDERFHAKFDEGAGLISYDAASNGFAVHDGGISFIEDAPFSFANDQGCSLEQGNLQTIDNLSLVTVGTDALPNTAVSITDASDPYLIIKKTNTTGEVSASIQTNVIRKQYHAYHIRMQVRLITTNDITGRILIQIGSDRFADLSLNAKTSDGWRMVTFTTNAYFIPNNPDAFKILLPENDEQEVHVRYISVEPITRVPIATNGKTDVLGNKPTFYNKVAYHALFSQAHCLSLNGIDEYVSFGQLSATANTAPNDGVIIRLLFKIASGAPSNRFFAVFNGNLSSGDSIGIDYQNIGIRHFCRLRTRSTEYREFDIELEKWTMMVAVIHNGKLQLRSINALADITLEYGAQTPYLSNDGHTVLGASYTTDVGTKFPSSFAFLAIDNYDEQLAQMVLNSNPYHKSGQELIRVHFGEGNGDQVYDVSGNEEHGTIISLDTTTQTGVWSQSQDVIGFNQIYGYNLINQTKIPLLSYHQDVLGNTPVSNPPPVGKLTAFEGGANLADNPKGKPIPGFADRPRYYPASSEALLNSPKDFLKVISDRSDLLMFYQSPIGNAKIAAESSQLTVFKSASVVSETQEANF